MASSYDPRVRALIVQAARREGVDPEAALAVAAGEGGIRFGAVGDSGTSFGPFQLHIGGALPKKYWGNAAAARAFANSPAGIAYAVKQMAAAGARGLRGPEAVEAIVRRFERPADPDTSVRNAIARLGTLGPIERSSSAAPVRPSGGILPGSADSGTGPDLRRQLALSLIGRASATAAGERSGLSGSLLQLAALRQQLGSAQEAFGPQPTSGPLVQGAGGGFVLPLSTPLTGRSEFGVADAEGAPDARGNRFHAGKDWFAPPGSTVRAPVAGKIVEVKPSRGNSGQVFGGTVKIQAPNGRVFVFRHVDPRNVKVGQTVKAGTPVASVTDWRDGGDHAHVEVWKSLAGGYRKENMLDPVAVFSRRRKRR